MGLLVLGLVKHSWEEDSERRFSGCTLTFSFKLRQRPRADVVPWAGAAEQALMPSFCLVWLPRLHRIAVFHQLKVMAGEPAARRVWRTRVGTLADPLG